MPEKRDIVQAGIVLGAILINALILIWSALSGGLKHG